VGDKRLEEAFYGNLISWLGNEFGASGLRLTLPSSEQ